VRRALRRLPEADRELLYMAYWEELSRVEIAAILGISAIAVRIRLMRARERFRHLLPREQDIHDEEAISDGRV
ncbi:RNA polymerase sigma factor, partial [Paraburkholderia sp. SIMBA_053]